jgi:lysophospholipase L1-like esterase
MGRGVVFALIGALLFEVSSLVALRVNYGQWLYSERANPNAWIFEEHPYVVALPIGNKSYSVNGVEIHHNSLGFRGPEFQNKGAKKRIVTIGGSTTYCVDVSDKDTWPYRLETLLGNDYEVLNLGMPGHSTAEHLYLLGSLVPRLEPDIIIMQIGLNDLHCMHSPDISPVLNRCHSTLLANSVGQCFVNKLPRLASVRAVVSTMQNVGFAPRCPPDPSSGIKIRDLDPRVVDAFNAQATSLVSIGKGMGAKVILVPQVGLKPGEIANGGYRWWTPYLDQEALNSFVASFNKELKRIAEATQVSYVDSVITTPWGEELFIDLSHLTGEGNLQLAKLVREKVDAQYMGPNKRGPVNGM